MSRPTLVLNSCTIKSAWWPFSALIAQLVERTLRKREVRSSTLRGGNFLLVLKPSPTPLHTLNSWGQNFLLVLSLAQSMHVLPGTIYTCATWHSPLLCYRYHLYIPPPLSTRIVVYKYSTIRTIRTINTYCCIQVQYNTTPQYYHYYCQTSTATTSNSTTTHTCTSE